MVLLDGGWFSMTAAECSAKTGQSLGRCEAYARAGLTVSQVTPEWLFQIRGGSAAEVKALVTHYLTDPEPMGECEPGCELCASDKVRRKHRLK